MCAPGLIESGSESGMFDSLTTGAGLTTKVVAGVAGGVILTSACGVWKIGGPCTVAGVQAYSANKVESMRSTRCILNIRKSWNPHYM